MNDSTQLWRELLTEPDLPEHIADEAKRRLRAFDRAEEHHREMVARHNSITIEANKARTEAPAQVASDHLSSSKPSTLRLAGDLTILETAAHEAHQASMIAKNALSRCSGSLSQLFTSSRDDLLAFVARRRAVDLGAFGYTEQITKSIERLWEKIRPTFYGNWPEETTLRPDFQRIPIVIDPSWSVEVRGGFAWIWQEIAEGHWEWSPAKGRPDQHPDRLRITSAFLRAPKVPKSPQHQTNPRLRFGIGN